jgi:cardiolipin synthase
MPLSFHRSGNELFPNLFEAIRNSKREILISLYTFHADRTGREFIELLTERARHGAHVRVIFDAFGSRGHELRILKRLRSAGVRARIFRPLPGLLLSHPLAFLCRDHARIFLFDRAYFSLGGIGFGNIYREREDLSIFMKTNQTACIAAYFDYLWNLAEKPKAKNEACAMPRAIGSGFTALFSGPRDEEQEAYRAAEDAISAARKRIVIMTPFFLPPRKLLKKILEAKQRGVAIEIITPLRTDKPRYDSFRAVQAPLLIQNGVSWRGTKKYFHQKFFIFDDRWIMGSANFDIISFERNYELCIGGTGGAMLRKLEFIAHEARQASRSISKFPAPWLFRNLTRICSGVLEFFLALT